MSILLSKMHAGSGKGIYKWRTIFDVGDDDDDDEA
jgi:hypothetical protein